MGWYPRTWPSTAPAYTIVKIEAEHSQQALSATLLVEKEQGTFRRLLTSPLHRGSLILGKMLAYTLVVVTLALAPAVTSLGMLVASVARSRSQAATISTILAVVLAVVGGVMTGVPAKGSALYWPSQPI